MTTSNRGGRRIGAGRPPAFDEPLEAIKVRLPISRKRRIEQRVGAGQVGVYLRDLIEEAESPQGEEWAIWREDPDDPALSGYEIGLYSCEDEAKGALEAAQEREPGVTFRLGIWPTPPESRGKSPCESAR